MLRNRWIALVISLLLLGLTGCTGTPDTPPQDIPARQEQEQLHFQAEQPPQTNAAPSSENNEPSTVTTTRRTESTTSPATDKSEAPVFQKPTNEEEATTHPVTAPETSALQIDREGICSLLFQNLTSTPDRPPNQKTITDPVMIQKMLGCIKQRAKTEVTDYEPVPGTMLLLSCAEADFHLALQHGDVIQYRDKFYRAEGLRQELMALYEQAVEPAQKLVMK